MPNNYRLGLVGWPVNHSLSPRLHAAALAAVGLSGEYRLIPVPVLPEGEAQIEMLASDLRAGRLHGLNVTIPHKQSFLPYLDDLSPETGAVGAANTLSLTAGRLHGDNTDIPGFLADLAQWEAVKPGPGEALILGAGGAARGVAYALRRAGWGLAIAARRVEQGIALATRLAQNENGKEQPYIPVLELQAGALQSYQTGAGLKLIVNTTPLGMGANPDNPWPAGISLPPGSAVYDLVYNPSITPLIRAAQEAGIPARNGLGMLVEQAARSFEIWTGKRVSRPAMWEAVQSY